MRGAAGATTCRSFQAGKTYYNSILICEDTLVPIGQVPSHTLQKLARPSPFTYDRLKKHHHRTHHG